MPRTSARPSPRRMPGASGALAPSPHGAQLAPPRAAVGRQHLAGIAAAGQLPVPQPPDLVGEAAQQLVFVRDQQDGRARRGAAGRAPRPRGRAPNASWRAKVCSMSSSGTGARSSASAGPSSRAGRGASTAPAAGCSVPAASRSSRPLPAPFSPDDPDHHAIGRGGIEIAQRRRGNAAEDERHEFPGYGEGRAGASSRVRWLAVSQRPLPAIARLIWSRQRHGRSQVLEQMRADWNRRAGEDAYYYVAFGRQQQDDDEFFATARDVVKMLDGRIEAPARPRRGARDRLRPRPPDAPAGRRLRRNPRRGRLRRDDPPRPRTAARIRPTPTRTAPPARTSRSSPTAIRFRLLLRRLPAHPQPRGGLPLSARGVARAQARRHPALPVQRPAAARQTVRHLERRAHHARRKSRVRARAKLPPAGAGRHLDAVHVDHLPQARRRRPRPRPPLPPSAASTTPSPAKPSRPMPATWRRSRCSIAGLPPDCDLNNLSVSVDDLPCRVAYIGPPAADGVTQVNAILPPGIRTGLLPVTAAGPFRRRRHAGLLRAGNAPAPSASSPPAPPCREWRRSPTASTCCSARVLRAASSRSGCWTWPIRTSSAPRSMAVRCAHSMPSAPIPPARRTNSISIFPKAPRRECTSCAFPRAARDLPPLSLEVL